jgi:hypothetical protein
MRATEFIRGLLDLIDDLDLGDAISQSQNDYVDEVPEIEVDIDTQYANSPDEMYTDSETIHSIGNDLHKPKHPSDIRSDSVSMYPNMQYNPGK